MVKPVINTSNWAVANPTLYNSPWSYDTQNRFFSLQPLGAGKDTTFTIRYLGNPVNVAFKGKHNVSGKDEPCLCFMFPSETDDADNLVCRLVQPCNFVSLLAFDGYRPIPAVIIKESKAGKQMASGGWFKKLWVIYSKEEQTEYKLPHDQQPVYPAPKNTPPKKQRKQQTILQSLHAGGPDGGVLSEDEKLGSGEEGDKEKSDDEQHVDVGGATSNSNPSPRSTVGEKSPRFDLTTWDGCLKYARANMERERDEQIKDAKNARKFQERLAEALDLNPAYDQDDLDCSDASSEEVDYNSDFERMVSEEADQIFERETKKIERSSSSGSTGSGGKGKIEKFEL